MQLIKREKFPSRFTMPAKRYKATVGIGGNVGDVVRRFDHLLQLLMRDNIVSLSHTSPILRNPPFGFAEQPDFFNAVIMITTDLNPRALLRYLLEVERKFGRKRLFKDGPRTLDLDLLFYEEVKMNHKDLTLPHPHWSERASVLLPLSHIGNFR